MTASQPAALANWVGSPQPAGYHENESDFGDIYWWRLPLAICYLLYYIFAALAPLNGNMMLGLLAILSFNICTMIGQMTRMMYATWRILQVTGSAADAPDHEALLKNRHVFVVPNYKEPLSVLRNTLQTLASHTHAKTYTIVLAMENKEAEHETKAASLTEEFRQCFDKVLSTAHATASHEMPGKSSNVNHAVRQVSTQLESDAILTILDADAEVCEKYVTELDKIANMRDIFAAPILFDMNTESTPFIVCVNDYMWAAMAIQNMSPFAGVVGFPMSAYSMSVNLVRRVQFWDTHPDAIGEDMHMFIKAFIRTKGEVKVQFVPAPINMGHVEGNSYLGTVWARVLQAERHMRGIADTAYTLKFFTQCGWKGVPLLLQVLEAHLLPFMVVNTLVVFPLYYNTFHAVPGAPMTFEMQYIDMVGKSAIFLGVIILSLYEVMRNAACKHLYNKKPYFKWYFFPFYAMLLVAAAPFILLPALYVIFKHVFNISSMNYYVAQKGGSN